MSAPGTPYRWHLLLAWAHLVAAGAHVVGRHSKMPSRCALRLAKWRMDERNRRLHEMIREHDAAWKGLRDARA